MKYYICSNYSYFANSCKYINTIFNLCNKHGHFGKVCKSETNISQKQTNTLNTVVILSVSYEKGTNI